MIRNLQCFKTLTFAILFLLLVHGILGEKKDGQGRNNPKTKGGSPKPTCPSPIFLNGDIKIEKDKFEFTCKENFTIYGRKNMKCVNGKFPHPTPVCTAPGCNPIGRLNSMLESVEPGGFKGKVINFRCHPGYTLKGLSSIHCNGLRWSKGQPQCIEDVESTTSPTTPRKEEKKSPRVFSITYPLPPRESPTIFRSRWTTVYPVQSSAVHTTPALPTTGASDSYATTADLGDVTPSISTEARAFQSSAVTTASLEFEKAPTTTEMPEDAQTETQKSTLEDDDGQSTFDHGMRRVTTQMDDTGDSRSEISEESDERPELTSSPAAITEMDEPDPTTMDEFPSSPADGSSPSPIDVLGHTDAGPSNEVELRRATSPKSDGRRTEIEQAQTEPLDFIAEAATYPKQDLETPEPLKKSTAGDNIQHPVTVDDKDAQQAATEAPPIKGPTSTIRLIFKTAATNLQDVNDEKYENPDNQVTTALIVLAVVAACVLIALVTYAVVIKVRAYRSQDPAQNEHAAIAYAEKEVNGSSAVNDATVKSHSTQL